MSYKDTYRRNKNITTGGKAKDLSLYFTKGEKNKVARKRMIDPSMWINEDFGTLSTLAKLVFIGLFSSADDEGRRKS